MDEYEGPRSLLILAIRKVQHIVRQHLEPGPGDCEHTINRLFEVFDRSDAVAPQPSG